MRKLFLLLTVIITLGACDSSNDPTPGIRDIDPSVVTEVDEFYAEAAKRNIKLSQSLIVRVVNEETSYTPMTSSSQQITLNLDRNRLDSYGPDQKEAYVFFYLGRLLLNRRLLIYTYSYMNPGLWYGYDQNDKNKLFDEMFHPTVRIP